MPDIPFSSDSLLRIYDAADDPLNNPDVEPLITADAVVDETESFSSTLTSHPVEDGSQINDNAQLDPQVFSISGIVSKTPLKFFQGLRDLFGPDPVTAALETFREIRARKIALTIIAGNGESYENRYMVTFTRNRNRETGQALAFSAVFQELRVVRSDTNPIPAEVSAAAVADTGQAAASGASGAAAGSANSVLSGVLGVGG